MIKVWWKYSLKENKTSISLCVSWFWLVGPLVVPVVYWHIKDFWSNIIKPHETLSVLFSNSTIFHIRWYLNLFSQGLQVKQSNVLAFLDLA